MPVVPGRRAYSAGELLALRRSASDEPALVIQNKAEQSAIKDHVVPGARTSANRSSSSYLPARVSQTSGNTRLRVLGEINPNNQNMRAGSSFRTSPTPSLKQKKAEEILKHHGSPPGMRVTAGGRIVPSDQSPLCSPRYGYSAVMRNGGVIKFAPGYPPPKAFQQSMKSLPNGFVAQDPSGKLCQMVDGRFLPVQEVNGLPQLYITAPNVNNMSSSRIHSSSGRDNDSGDQQLPHANRPFTDQVLGGPTVSAQILALEKQYQKLEVERRGLDKAEVLQRSEMTTKAYNQLINQRRQLVQSQDELRRSIRLLQDAQASAEAPFAPTHTATSSPETFADTFHYSDASTIPRVPIPAWSFHLPKADTRGQGAIQAPTGGPDAPYYIPSPYFPAGAWPTLSGIPSYFPPDANMFGGGQNHGEYLGTGQFSQQSQVPQLVGELESPTERQVVNDASSTRSANASAFDHSQLPATAQRGGKGIKSSLNPMSAAYEPTGSNITTPKKADKENAKADFAKAIQAHNEWVERCEDTENEPSLTVKAESMHNSSASSYATADFFPNNPRDHSLNKKAYPISSKKEVQILSKPIEIHTPPSDEHPRSPEKERFNSEWNPDIPDHVFQPRTVSAEQGSPPAKATTGANAKEPIDDPLLTRSNLSVSPKNKLESLPKRGASVNLNLGSLDFSQSSFAATPRSCSHGSDYAEGYRAGLVRATVPADKGRSYLDGYCVGLLKSAEPKLLQGDHSVSPKTKSPGSSMAERMANRTKNFTPPSLDLKPGPVEQFKQAVMKPQNENAVLSPTEETPHVDAIEGETLGSWSQSRESSLGVDNILSQLRNGQTAFPERTSSMVGRQLSNQSNSSLNKSSAADTVPKAATDEVMSTGLENSNVGHRHFSSQTQPAQSSYLHRAYSGHRVLSSPALEWKSGHSIAQVAGLATGFFSQYDGTLGDLIASSETTPLTRHPTASGTSGKIVNNNGKEPIHNAHAVSPKFKEATMPHDESPMTPSSPQGSPSKRTSPAKARFAQIAGKAGIKVGAPRQNASKDMTEASESDPLTLQEKRKWKDLWKKRHMPAQE